MAPADQPSSMLRRTLFAAPALLATPAAGGASPATVSLPVAPPGKIWVCVAADPWTAFVEAAYQLIDNGGVPNTSPGRGDHTETA